jgi:uncharacterized BrkB/YihY/UPF0761 family membrane protein
VDESEHPPTDDAADGRVGRGSLVGRARSGKQRVVDRAVVARDQLESARHRSSTLDAALQAMERDSEIGGGVLAAAVGFRVFLFLVPYTFVWVAGFGVASQVSSKSPEAAARAAGITGLIARSLGDFGKLSTGERLIALGIGLFALVVAARALVKTLAIVHVLVWGDVDRRKVSSTKGAALLVALVTAAVALSGLVGWLRSESFVAGLFGIGLFMAVPFGLWLVVSWLLPHAPDLPWWALLPGAAVLAVGVEVLHVVTVYWISREIATKADRYGALGVALALLLWSYLLGRLVVAATVTNASMWRRSVGRGGGAGRAEGVGVARDDGERPGR